MLEIYERLTDICMHSTCVDSKTRHSIVSEENFRGGTYCWFQVPIHSTAKARIFLGLRESGSIVKLQLICSKVESRSSVGNIMESSSKRIGSSGDAI